MNAVEPYDPINTLKTVAEDVWIVDGPIIRFRWLGMRLPFPTRMTLIRLADGGLWVHSPTEPSAALRAAIDRLGPVRHLIAPNRIHYWWIGDWKHAYPGALTYAAPGVRERAAARRIVFDRDLTQDPDDAWAGQIDQLLVPGSFLTEAVFFHRRSRTLILADLIENFEAERIRSPVFRLLCRLTGCMHPDGKVPIDLRLTFMKHRRAVRQAVERMIAWDPERVILAHGRWYANNAAGELERAFRWTGRLESHGGPRHIRPSKP